MRRLLRRTVPILALTVASVACATALAQGPLADAAPPACEARAANLAGARAAFARRCAGSGPRDCDPVAGGWACSTDVLGAGAPPPTGAALPGRAPAKAPVRAPEPPPALEPEPEPTAPVSPRAGACRADAAGLGDARAAFARRCPGLEVRDCDPVDGRWVCSSEALGASAPPVTAAAPEPVPRPPRPEPEPEPEPVPQSPRPEPEPEPEPEPGPGPESEPGSCTVDSIGELRSCLDAADAHDRIEILSDLACEGEACCPGGGALVRLRGTEGLAIDGNGHRLLRGAGHRRCSLLEARGVRGLSLLDWHLDDDASVAPCVVGDGCPRMIHLRDGSDVTMSGVTVTASKGYAIYVDGVDGFAFVDSALTDSGVLGLYVGHDERASSRVRIERSRFEDNQTNAVALLGVVGSSTDDNLIVDNVFARNHFRGQWPVAPRYGTGFTGGGQLYIAKASGVTVSGNRIEEGACENCFDQGRLGSGVSGIELGLPGKRSVSNLTVRDNLITGQDAWGIYANQGSPMDDGVAIIENLLLGNGTPFSVGGARAQGNTTGAR